MVIVWLVLLVGAAVFIAWAIRLAAKGASQHGGRVQTLTDERGFEPRRTWAGRPNNWRGGGVRDGWRYEVHFTPNSDGTAPSTLVTVAYQPVGEPEKLTIRADPAAPPVDGSLPADALAHLGQLGPSTVRIGDPVRRPEVAVTTAGVRTDLAGFDAAVGVAVAVAAWLRETGRAS